MATALDVARYFVELALQKPVPEALTLPRLQGLLLYAQGWHLGSFDVPLFGEPIVFSDDGPIVAEVVDAVRRGGDDPSQPIRAEALGAPTLEFRECQFVIAIWEKYRGYSAAGIQALLNEEKLWLDSPQAEQDNGRQALSHAALRMHFLRREELRGFNPTEWESAVKGDEELERGGGIPWDEVKRRLRERPLPAHPVANGRATAPGDSTLPAG